MKVTIPPMRTKKYIQVDAETEFKTVKMRNRESPNWTVSSILSCWPCNDGSVGSQCRQKSC